MHKLKRTDWMNWSLTESKPLSLNITFPEKKAPLYDIELSRINTHWKVLHWVFHLAQKDWITKEDIYNFILACQELREAGMLSLDPKDNFNEYYLEC